MAPTHSPNNNEDGNIQPLSHSSCSPTDADSSRPFHKSHHHISQLNRACHGFHGFRVAISRHKTRFCRYFSIRQFGSKEAALAFALNVRDYVLENLEQQNTSPVAIENIFTHARMMTP